MVWKRPAFAVGGTGFYTGLELQTDVGINVPQGSFPPLATGYQKTLRTEVPSTMHLMTQHALATPCSCREKLHVLFSYGVQQLLMFTLHILVDVFVLLLFLWLSLTPIPHY